MAEILREQIAGSGKAEIKQNLTKPLPASRRTFALPASDARTKEED
ncbi:MAG TPA: hypothetical protein VFV61_06680 [Pyrinomonadaceae bacterium]|nr:hypothetical protein [Pyrinomonadaceae bacterium]